MRRMDPTTDTMVRVLVPPPPGESGLPGSSSFTSAIASPGPQKVLMNNNFFFTYE